MQSSQGCSKKRQGVEQLGESEESLQVDNDDKGTKEQENDISDVRAALASVKEHAISYCESTSVHGFAYLVNRRHWGEGVFWAIIIATGLTLASVIINDSLRWGKLVHTEAFFHVLSSFKGTGRPTHGWLQCPPLAFQ